MLTVLITKVVVEDDNEANGENVDGQEQKQSPACLFLLLPPLAVLLLLLVYGAHRTIAPPPMSTLHAPLCSPAPFNSSPVSWYHDQETVETRGEDIPRPILETGAPSGVGVFKFGGRHDAGGRGRPREGKAVAAVDLGGLVEVDAAEGLGAVLRFFWDG